MLGSTEVGVDDGLCWVSFHHQAASCMELVIDWEGYHLRSVSKNYCSAFVLTDHASHTNIPTKSIQILRLLAATLSAIPLGT